MRACGTDAGRSVFGCSFLVFVFAIIEFKNVSVATVRVPNDSCSVSRLTQLSDRFLSSCVTTVLYHTDLTIENKQHREAPSLLFAAFTPSVEPGASAPFSFPLFSPASTKTRSDNTKRQEIDHRRHDF
jgi:hypothetical protein